MADLKPYLYLVCLHKMSHCTKCLIVEQTTLVYKPEPNGEVNTVQGGTHGHKQYTKKYYSKVP